MFGPSNTSQKGENGELGRILMLTSFINPWEVSAPAIEDDDFTKGTWGKHSSFLANASLCRVVEKNRCRQMEKTDVTRTGISKNHISCFWLSFELSFLVAVDRYSSCVRTRWCFLHAFHRSMIFSNGIHTLAIVDTIYRGFVFPDGSFISRSLQPQTLRIQPGDRRTRLCILIPQRRHDRYSVFCSFLSLSCVFFLIVFSPLISIYRLSHSSPPATTGVTVCSPIHDRWWLMRFAFLYNLKSVWVPVVPWHHCVLGVVV